MPQTVQLAHIVLVKTMEDSLEIAFFVRPHGGALIQVSPDRIGTDVCRLQSAELFAGGGERDIDHMT